MGFHPLECPAKALRASIPPGDVISIGKATNNVLLKLMTFQLETENRSGGVWMKEDTAVSLKFNLGTLAFFLFLEIRRFVSAVVRVGNKRFFDLNSMCWTFSSISCWKSNDLLNKNYESSKNFIKNLIVFIKSQKFCIFFHEINLGLYKLFHIFLSIDN